MSVQRRPQRGNRARAAGLVFAVLALLGMLVRFVAFQRLPGAAASAATVDALGDVAHAYQVTIWASTAVAAMGFVGSGWAVFANRSNGHRGWWLAGAVSFAYLAIRVWQIEPGSEVVGGNVLVAAKAVPTADHVAAVVASAGGRLLPPTGWAGLVVAVVLTVWAVLWQRRQD
jgi:hypothetical protein